MTPPTNEYPVSDTMRAVPLELIRVSPENTRSVFTDDTIAALLASMNALGQQSAISIFHDLAPPPDKEQFSVLCGNQRLLAANRGRWRTINAIIVPPPATCKDALIHRLAENRARTDLSILDHVNGIVRVFDLDPQITNKALSESSGYSQWEVSTAKTIRACPVAFAALTNGLTTGWKDTREVATAPEHLKAALVEKRAAGGTCDAIRKAARKPKAEADALKTQEPAQTTGKQRQARKPKAEAVKLQRVIFPLSADTKVMFTGPDPVTPTDFYNALASAMEAARGAMEEERDIREAQKSWADKAKAKNKTGD